MPDGLPPRTTRNRAGNTNPPQPKRARLAPSQRSGSITGRAERPPVRTLPPTALQQPEGNPADRHDDHSQIKFDLGGEQAAKSTRTKTKANGLFASDSGPMTAGAVLRRIRRQSRDESEKGRWFEQLFMRLALQEPEFEIAEIHRWADWPAPHLVAQGVEPEAWSFLRFRM